MARKKRVCSYLIIFLVCFVPRCILSLKAIPLRTLSDELSTLNGAAMVAGYDWSNVVSNAGYYGFGMTAVFSFIFKLFKNPIIMYRAFMVCFALLQSITGLIAYYILSDSFPEKKETLLIVLSSVLSYCVVTRANVAYNEHGLIFVCWIITLLVYNIFRYRECTKKTVIYSMLLAITIAYSQMIHSRAKIFLIAGLICVAVYIISHIRDNIKKMIIVALFISTTVIAICIANRVVLSYQMGVWGGDGVRNTQVQLSTDAGFDLLRLKAIAMIIFGQLNTFALVTAGGIIVSIVCFIHMVAHVVHDKKIGEYLNQGYIYITLFFLLCFCGTILAQAISWSVGVKVNMVTNGAEWIYSLKALTYIRYAGPYLGPIILFAIIYMLKNEKDTNKIALFSMIIVLAMQKYWMKYIVPYCVRTPDGSEAYLCFSASEPWTHSERLFSMSMIILIVVAFIITVLIKKNIKILAAACILLYMMYQYGYNAINYDLYIQKKESESFIEVYDYIVDNGVLKDIENNNLYAVDTSKKNDHQFYYLAQFYFYDYKIQTDVPQSYDKNFVIISNEPQKIIQKLDPNMEYHVEEINDYYIIRYLVEY